MTEVTEKDQDPSNDMSYFTAVVADESRSSWNTTVTVNGREILFKLDTGAEVTMISDRALKALGRSELRSSKKRLVCVPDSNPLHVLYMSLLSCHPPWSTNTCSICSEVLQYCKTGWPTRQEKGDLTSYWRVRGELCMCEGLLLYGTRIVVPKSLQSETLQKIHQGHQGIQSESLLQCGGQGFHRRLRSS